MGHLGQRGALALLVASLVLACAEQRFRLGFETDTQAPTVSIVKTAGDTMDVAKGVQFTVSARDNLGLKTITISLRGGLLLDTAITFTSAVTTADVPVNLPQPPNSTVGGRITIDATATDGNNNSATARDSIFVINLKALSVTLFKPTPGAVTAPGKQLPIEVLATQVSGIRLVGWEAVGAVNVKDSAFYANRPNTVRLLDTLAIPANASAGTFLVSGFAVDSAGRRVSSSAVTVTVQLVVADSIGPVVSFSVPRRVEVRDSITVRARDPSGVASIGWVARDAGGTVLGGKTTTLGGTLTDVSVTDNLNLSLTAAQLPKLAVIKAFATDAAGNTDSARVDTLRVAPVRADSITVVNGITKPLPAGGRIADAIFNRNQNRVYLTNIDLDRLEVFDVSDTSFKTPIPVGSRPWGIALWPRNAAAGTNADTVIVANSGGTDLSIVDVSLRQQRRRVQLPLFRVQTVHSKVDPATGVINLEITEYTVSDRPQYLAVVCRGGGTCKPGGAGDVLAVYSTTPTAGQTNPLPRRGTVRWENLTSATPQSHLFWEQAGATFTSANDTLQLFVNRGPTVPEELVLGALCGRVVNKQELGFLDTTFVRNSGNFSRIIIGEGGSSATPALAFARALTYDVSLGLQTNTCGTQSEQVDLGIAGALAVRSFIANTAIPVRAVGINFNGLVSLVRADSVYVVDQNLRLKGLMSIGGPNFGMDLNFNHDFDPNTGASASGTVTKDERVAFVASPDPQIDVFDTFYFGKLASIPIRDPVIGPLRVAKLPSGEQVLIGVTARGVVTVRLPAISNSFPASRWPGGQP
jgi:hypothetical protein